MKTRYKILLVFIFLMGLNVKGQNNLIHNAVIEQPVNDSTPFYPGLVDDRTVKSYYYASGWQTDNWGHQDGLSVWEDDIKVITTVLEEPGQLPEKVDLLLHSPDWFMTNTYNYNSYNWKKLRIIENQVDIVPHSGLGYLGMGPGELVQQKFFNANKFEEGKQYTLNFYIRPISDQNSSAESDKIGGQGYGGDWSTGLDLKVYLRKNDMKYSAAANNKNNRCDPSKFYKKQSTNNTITVINHHVNLTSYPTGQWYPITIEFTAPASNYDWFIVETQSNSLCNSPYLLLDDFMLTQTCEFPSCDRTGGEVFPNHNGLVSINVPLTITNLNNAQSVTVEVVTIPGQSPIWSYSTSCTNGIQEPIYWDGRNTSGYFAANAAYFLKVTSTNDCGTETKTSTIVKNGNYNTPITNNIVCNTSGIETPIPCCIYQPDLVIDNVTLPGLGLLDYRVLNKINVAPSGNVTVTGNAHVEMRAGYEITLNPGFEALSGCNFLAEIVPCTNSGKLRSSNVEPVTNIVSNNDLNEQNKVTQEINLSSIDSNEVSSFDAEIYPNPTVNGIFNVNLLSSSSQSYIEITNLVGVTVYHSLLKQNSNIIDISNQPNGIYIVRLTSKEQNISKKIIKQ
jgi:flagellar hook assembly protein FlgD